MVVQVCIGSACHLKGSYVVIQKLKSLIEEHKLEDVVELKSSFCLGECANGVSVKINSQKVKTVLPKDVEKFFETEILGGLER